jgi:hypothetical protein
MILLVQILKRFTYIVTILELETLSTKTENGHDVIK